MTNGRRLVVLKVEFLVEWFLEVFVDDGDIAGVMVYHKHCEDEEGC